MTFFRPNEPTPIDVSYYLQILILLFSSFSRYARRCFTFHLLLQVSKLWRSEYRTCRVFGGCDWSGMCLESENQKRFQVVKQNDSYLWSPIFKW